MKLSGLFCLPFVLLACGSDVTTGREIVLSTRIAADAESVGEFTTGTGWTIRLSRAQVSLASLYYFDGEPAYVMNKRNLYRHLALLSPLSVAHAHPGHYAAGMALGQMTTPSYADLLAGEAALPPGNGITGTYRSARFSFASPTSEPALSALGGKVAAAEGVARKGEQTIFFRVAAEFADVARSVSGARVEGCAFAEADVEGDGAVSVQVRPRVWFNLVDFREVAPGTEASPTDIAAGSTPQVAFALGLAQLSAYHFSYSP